MKILALLALLMLPLFANAAEKRSHINLPNRESNLPFSDAVLVGDTLYVSGRIGLDPRTGQAPANLDQEIKLLLDGFQAVLAASGMTMDDLVQVTIFCPDVSLFDKWNAAYRKYFKGELPARAFIGSGPLLRGGHFEMLGVARK